MTHKQVYTHSDSDMRDRRPETYHVAAQMVACATGKQCWPLSIVAIFTDLAIMVRWNAFLMSDLRISV